VEVNKQRHKQKNHFAWKVETVGCKKGRLDNDVVILLPVKNGKGEKF